MVERGNTTPIAGAVGLLVTPCEASGIPPHTVQGEVRYSMEHEVYLIAGQTFPAEIAKPIWGTNLSQQAQAVADAQKEWFNDWLCN